MNTPDCNLYMLRNLLLEGENAEKIVNVVGDYHSSEKTAEDYDKVTGFLRKEITATAKNLMSDTQLDAFITELSKEFN